MEDIEGQDMEKLDGTLTRLDDTTVAEVDAFCRQVGLSRSEIARLSIKFMLKTQRVKGIGALLREMMD